MYGYINDRVYFGRISTMHFFPLTILGRIWVINSSLFGSDKFGSRYLQMLDHVQTRLVLGWFILGLCSISSLKTGFKSDSRWIIGYMDQFCQIYNHTSISLLSSTLTLPYLMLHKSCYFLIFWILKDPLELIAAVNRFLTQNSCLFLLNWHIKIETLTSMKKCSVDKGNRPYILRTTKNALVNFINHWLMLLVSIPLVWMKN